MAVVPIRSQMMSAPAAAAPMSSPAQQGWVWNGSSWVWDQDCCPPWWGCQPCPPPAPLPPPPLTGPIVGVVDGSNAAPGQVGEYVSSASSIPYAAYPANTTQIVSAIIVQPGDWDLWALMSLNTEFGGALFYLSPLPPGMADDLAAMNAVTAAMTATTAEFSSLNAPAVRGSFSVPTLLAFTVNINQSFNSGLLAGTATLKVRGRRRR